MQITIKDGKYMKRTAIIIGTLILGSILLLSGYVVLGWLTLFGSLSYYFFTKEED